MLEEKRQLDAFAEQELARRLAEDRQFQEDMDVEKKKAKSEEERRSGSDRGCLTESWLPLRTLMLMTVWCPTEFSAYGTRKAMSLKRVPLYSRFTVTGTESPEWLSLSRRPLEAEL